MSIWVVKEYAYLIQGHTLILKIPLSTLSSYGLLYTPFRR